MGVKIISSGTYRFVLILKYDMNEFPIYSMLLCMRPGHLKAMLECDKENTSRILFCEVKYLNQPSLPFQKFSEPDEIPLFGIYFKTAIKKRLEI